MNQTKKYFKRRVVIILIIAIITIISILLIKYQKINNILIDSRQKEQMIKDIKFEVYSNENDILKVLVIAEDTENGINKLIYVSEQGEEEEIKCYGKTKITLDYKIVENGNYEFKAINEIGEEIIKILTVDDNYRNNLINIKVDTESEIATKGIVTINYNTSGNKKRMYKIGENGIWTDYNGEFEITSYEIIENNWQNTEEKNITIYVKIEDDAKNIVQIEKKIDNIDVDIAKMPKINILNVDEYPTITKEGIINNSTISIDYDSRIDITNYYSIDNGKTWTEYTEELNLTSATIMAKSVKNNSGLEIVEKEFINSSASDSIRAKAYDNDYTTFMEQPDPGYVLDYYANVKEDAIGSTLTIKYSRHDWSYNAIEFLDENNEVIKTDVIKEKSMQYNGMVLYYKIIGIPIGTKKLKYIYTNGWYGTHGTYEIEVKDYIDKELETGEYVQYTANNYSKWIVVGTDDNNVTRIVSAGATDYYIFDGKDQNDAFKKLDDYCNSKYVDNNLATFAESYSYSRNISPYTKEKGDIIGDYNETPDEVKAQYSYDWFISNNEPAYGGVNVRSFDYHSTSYINLGDGCLIRPVVTLKKEIRIIRGQGTKEFPYIIELK